MTQYLSTVERHAQGILRILLYAMTTLAQVGEKKLKVLYRIGTADKIVADSVDFCGDQPYKQLQGMRFFRLLAEFRLSDF